MRKLIGCGVEFSFIVAAIIACSPTPRQVAIPQPASPPKGEWALWASKNEATVNKDFKRDIQMRFVIDKADTKEQCEVRKLAKEKEDSGSAFTYQCTPYGGEYFKYKKVILPPSG